MKNKSKYYRIPVCIFVFVVGSITAMLFASVLNDVLTTGSISTDLTDFSTTISGVFGGEKPRKLYLLLEALVVLLCVVYFVCAERTYQTDTYKVTDNISVPVPSGQGQHGTAWFMSDKIKRRAFDYISISKSDPLISRLVSIGENRYRAIENGEAFNPPKADQTLTDSAGIFLAREMSRGTERASDKLSITLETVDSDIWEDIFGIDEELKQYVEQSQLAIEMALDEAEIPQDERTISLDGMVQAALFVYFEGFFDLPVSSSELAPGGNGILSQCGEVSELHQYTYGTKDMGVPEKGITLALKEKTAVHANLLDRGDCIQDIYVYDVWNMDEQDIANDTNSKVFNRSAVTLAYIIDTDQFEADYGFPFPSIDGVSNAGTITLFLEFTCLSEVEFEDADIGNSLDFGDIIMGYSHDGYDSGLWRHSLNRDECVPHVGVKTYFMSGEVSQPEPPLGTHYYCGPSAKDIGAAANPRLWFKGFRTGMSEELFGTIRAVGE